MRRVWVGVSFFLAVCFLIFLSIGGGGKLRRLFASNEEKLLYQVAPRGFAEGAGYRLVTEKVESIAGATVYGISTKKLVFLGVENMPGKTARLKWGIVFPSGRSIKIFTTYMVSDCTLRKKNGELLKYDNPTAIDSLVTGKWYGVSFLGLLGQIGEGFSVAPTMCGRVFSDLTPSTTGEAETFFTKPDITNFDAEKRLVAYFITEK